ncbi:MAG: SCO family protein [Nitrospirae bacterium]|nr:SCO family protein [Nitrospirota bacterium]
MKTFLLSLLLFVSLFEIGLADTKKLTSPNEKMTLGKEVPDVILMDSYGKERSLKDVIGNKPLIISLIYTRCQTACLVITDSLNEAVEKIGNVGKDFNILTLSFDSTDTPEMLAKFRTMWGLEKPGWVVANGREKELEKLLKAIDFSYRLDEETGEFIHPNLLVILSPAGKISKYIYGVNYNARDLRLSMIEAKKGNSSASVTEGLLLWCYQYDPLTGTYKVDVAFILEVISGIAFLLFVLFVFFGKAVIATIRATGRFIFRRGVTSAFVLLLLLFREQL